MSRHSNAAEKHNYHVPLPATLKDAEPDRNVRTLCMTIAAEKAPSAVTNPLPPDPNRLIRLRDVLGLVPVAASTWWLWVSKGNAPAPVRLGRCTCLRYSEVIAMTTSGGK